MAHKEQFSATALMRHSVITLHKTQLI